MTSNSLIDEKSLRDYFAASALQGILSLNPRKIGEWIHVETGNKQKNDIDCICEGIYEIADAMLKARARGL